METALKFVRKRCPNLTEEELQEAAENWLNYLDVVWRSAPEKFRKANRVLSAASKSLPGRGWRCLHMSRASGGLYRE